jgi:hypothetical protein
VGIIGKITEILLGDSLREIVTEQFKDYTVKAKQISPFGIDSCPQTDRQSVSIKLGGSTGKFVNIGVYNNNEVDEGEISIFSEDGDKVKVCNIYLDATGNINVSFDSEIIFNEGSDFMVRYNELETAFNQLKQDHDDFINNQHNASVVPHTHTFSYNAGPTPASGSTSPAVITTGLPSTADITPAKVDNMKIQGVVE